MPWGIITPDTVTPAPAAPRQPIVQAEVPKAAANAAYARIIAGYNPAVHTSAYVGRILDALCAPPSEARQPGLRGDGPAHSVSHPSIPRQEVRESRVVGTCHARRNQRSYGRDFL